MLKSRWPLVLVVASLGAAGLVWIGARTYVDAPPIPDFVASDGTLVIASARVLDGQEVFLRRALMEHGSFFGDGGARGPDFTAEALRRTAISIREQHVERLAALGEVSGEDAAALAEVLARREIRANTFDPATGRVVLTPGQVRAVRELREWTRWFFGSGERLAFQPAGYVEGGKETELLADFFFWGGWVCGATRPGASHTYTHGWPFDPIAGTTPSPDTLSWSVIGALALILGLGVVLYARGIGKDAGAFRASARRRPLSVQEVEADVPHPLQRLAWPFFAIGIVLFSLQVLAGILTVHDFVGLTTIAGVDLREWLPLPVVRTWHLQLALLWMSSCWVGATLFVLPTLRPSQPPGQRRLALALLALLVVVTAGSVAGAALGPLGLLGDQWRLLGHQGWEFLELGRLWQVLLFVAFILWAVIVLRGTPPLFGRPRAFSLPGWLAWTVAAVPALFVAGFVAGPRTNFVIADFWRWCVIHMWVEAFFEVFTTAVAGAFLVGMGLVSRGSATRLVHVAAILFLGSGLLGISHNFYWNAKPVAALAIGSVFSTLQVVPLVLLTLEAWTFRRLPAASTAPRGTAASFAHPEAFLFLLAVNAWNFLGAGVFGFAINLPIVNYYEHGSYLTVNHGHAALMGVYGNLSIAVALAASRHLLRPGAWHAGLARSAFWALNVGLALMVLLDLFPAGLLQLRAILEGGLVAGRSQEFILGTGFQTLTWMRMVGGALFVLGGVLPLLWFFTSRSLRLKPAAGGP